MNNIVIIDKLKKDQEFVVGNNENKTFVILLLDGETQTGDVNIKIKGSKANVQILGLILGFGEQKIDLYSFQDHVKAQSVSDLFIKSVLFDRAKFYYRGLIKIEKNAQKSNAYQKNQNLLLSKSAWADSRPYLEILANDVRCTHGATVGKIDNEQLYYLQSRGLGIVAATQMIVEGYCSEVLDRIGNDKIRRQLQEKVSKNLKSLLARQLN